MDKQGRRHQDLIFVDKNWDCTLQDLPSPVREGFDGVHQAVRALLSRPRPRPGGASTPAASASSAAPAMLALSPPPPPEPPAPSVAASVASTADEAPAAAARPAPASPAASVTEAPVAAPTRPKPQVAVSAVPAAAAASTRGVLAVDSRGSKSVFKTHCDHVFGGQTWFDVLCQMGGCPAAFVDAWNTVINQRLEATPKLVLILMLVPRLPALHNIFKA